MRSDDRIFRKRYTLTASFGSLFLAATLYVECLKIFFSSLYRIAVKVFHRFNKVFPIDEEQRENAAMRGRDTD